MSHIPLIHLAKAEFLPYTDKTVAGKDVYELKIQIDSDSVDARVMRDLRRARTCFISIDCAQKKLPGVDGEPVQNHPGQLEAFEVNADAEPDGPVPVKYSLLLLQLPTEEKQLKAAKKWLRKHTGLKAADLDVELEALAAGAGYLVIEGGNEPFVMETRMEMERLGMVVSTHPWAQKSEGGDAPEESHPLDALLNPLAPKVSLDQLTVGSQWLLKGIGTQVRIHNIQGEKVYFHSLYALYSSIPAWVFAAAVTPVESLADLEAVDLAKWENAEVKAVQLDPETEARLQEPWLMPVVELPLGAAVEYQGRARVIQGALIEGGQPVAILRHMDSTVDESESVAVSEMVEPISTPELSPLVVHALGAAQLDQAMSEPMTDADWKAAGMPENASGDEETPTEEDPSESTAVSDGGEERLARPVALDDLEPEAADEQDAA